MRFRHKKTHVPGQSGNRHAASAKMQGATK